MVTCPEPVDASIFFQKVFVVMQAFIFDDSSVSALLPTKWCSWAMQAYVGIHQPKDLNDADLARRRFIFDEFFYLQVI